jgi:hypothetical protein
MVRRWLAMAIMAASVGCISAAPESDLVTGMPLEDALAILRKNDIKAVVENGGYVAAAGFEEAKCYYVLPNGSQDALYFVAARKPDEASLKLTSLYWWKDWVNDSKQPKGLRKNRYVDVDKISLKSLK